MKRIYLAALGAALLAGCQTMSQNETAGALLGGVAGAVLGNQFGSGDGRVAMTAIGAVIGATVGAQIAESLDARIAAAGRRGNPAGPEHGAGRGNGDLGQSHQRFRPRLRQHGHHPGRGERRRENLPGVQADHYGGGAGGNRSRGSLPGERRQLGPHVASGTPFATRPLRIVPARAGVLDTGFIVALTPAPETARGKASGR